MGSAQPAGGAPLDGFWETGEMQIEDQFAVTAEGAVRLNDIPHDITEV